MTGSDIKAIFGRFPSSRVGVIGDFAVDLYFELKTKTGESSIETGLDVFWGSRPRASLGAAGNVVQNLAALGIANIHVIGCIGDDLFGREMQHLFSTLGVDTTYLQVVSAWDTCLYTKPTVNDQETNRIDFGTGNCLTDEQFESILAGLELLLPNLDVLIINQQFANPLLPVGRMQLLNNLISRFPNVRFLADMRDTGTQVYGSTLKVNTAELARFLAVPHPSHPDLDWCIQQGTTFQKRLNGPLLITRGPAGILFLDDTGYHTVDGLMLTGPLDTVGAGDTVVATWAACLGAGTAPQEALLLANLAAAVTVQKLNQTGTANLSELLEQYKTHYVHD